MNQNHIKIQNTLKFIVIKIIKLLVIKQVGNTNALFVCFFRDTFYKIQKLNNFICISIASLLICMLSSQCQRNICWELSTDHDRRLSLPWCYAWCYQRNGGPYWRRQLFHALSLTRSLKMVETQSLGISPIFFRHPAWEDKNTDRQDI